MEQWRGAARALAEERRARLAGLSPARALAAADAVLSLASSRPLGVARRTSSGLVEQQALLQRLRSNR
jgi:hypothetical protein